MATKHIIRLPEGCTIHLECFLPEIPGEEHPDRRWRGTLEAHWKGDDVKVEHESAGLIGIVGQLAKKWSQACPNSAMRKKAARADIMVPMPRQHLAIDDETGETPQTLRTRAARSDAAAEAGAEPHE